MKTSRSPSRGLVKFSRLCLTSKNSDAPTSSSKNTLQTPKEEVETNVSISELSKSIDDSPYKNSLTYFKAIPPIDDADDFKTPEPIKKFTKLFQPRGVSLNKRTRTRQPKTKSAKNKNSIIKLAKDNFGKADVNPDHLQMALALSKSTYELENPEKSKDIGEDLPNFLSPDKIPKGKTTLEKFGFKSDKPKLPPRVKRDGTEVSKKKNSKFRFMTPTLQVRTPEEREAIITSKISLILYQNSDSPTDKMSTTCELFSDLLMRYKKHSMIFEANSLKLKDALGFNYYVKSLNITPTKSKCGHLLRNWGEIIGRDRSPVREKLERSEDLLSKDCDKTLENQERINSKATNNRDENVVQKQILIEEKSNAISSNKTEVAGQNLEDRNCISPDLFASDDETEFVPKTPEPRNDFSQSLLNLSPSRSQASRQGLLEHSNSTVSHLGDSQEKKLKCSKRNVFKNDQGIEHFESYCHDFKSFSQEIYHLVQSSEDEDTEDLYLHSLKNERTIAESKSTQNSSEGATNEEVSVVGNCKQREGKVIEGEFIGATDSNFYMSPLFIKQFTQNSFIANGERPSKTKALDLGCAQISHSPLAHDGLSPRRSSVTGGLNSTAMLNVTDYITQILNQDEGTVDVNEGASDSNCSISCKKYVSERWPHSLTPNSSCSQRNSKSFDDSPDKELDLSQGSCSQESIIISDEELNYSSVNSKIGTNSEKHIASLGQGSCSHECIVVSDEELSDVTNGRKHFYHLSDTDEDISGCNDVDNGMDIEDANNAHTALKAKYGSQNISEPVHNRITELKRNSSTRKSLGDALLEDSFNDLLEDTAILETIESAAEAVEARKVKELIREPTGKQMFVNKRGNIVTPEKHDLQIAPSASTSDMTPENLIIKTDNITPMAKYDDMDTPKVTKELQQFGLKPLKRQRGVKLLKYLYECTHPLVGPREIEEISSDDDTHREVKKKKGNNAASDESNHTSVRNNCRYYQGDVEIVGDLLLENENLEDLIFERKYSVKIPSCRVPLQIVWHNFVSQNPAIKEDILLYEPLQVEVLHSMLKEQTGCKFHIQDLLTFFDKKCITIRTAQAQGGRRARK